MSAHQGIVAILIAFPVYLLWKGRLPAYLALLKTPAPNPSDGSTVTVTSPSGNPALDTANAPLFTGQ